MLSWIWGTLFGDDAAEQDDDETVRISMSDLRSITAEIDTLQQSVRAASESLASSDKNTLLFCQSIEALLLETFDAPAGHPSTSSPETAQLQEMRAGLEEERAAVTASLTRQRELTETRLFRAQMQIRALEKQRENLEAAVQQLDNPQHRTGRVVFPVVESPEFTPKQTN
ncbi:hypothetical protein NESM_000139500 [Novymonas esmeraldas]|uniref:Uncharacterized protein n=1 Tax=Novymonas esmeraldas TaxID=1808958 RepID=A0AAW0F580_9TRYP